MIFLARLYAALLYLYPREFRAQFGDEMLAVFVSSISQAQAQNGSTLLFTCLREFGDLPVAILQEHWQERKNKRMARHPTFTLPLHLRLWHVVALVGLSIAVWYLRARFWGSVSLLDAVVWVIPIFLFGCALVWAARRSSARLWIFAGAVVLTALFLPASAIPDVFPNITFQPSDTQTHFIFFLAMPAAFIVAALLFYSGKTSRVALILAVLLLAAVVYNYYWFIVWDTTGDSLGIFWLVFASVPILFSALVLLALLPEKTKRAGNAYLLVIPILFTASRIAEQVDFRQLTEQHAAQTSQAIESYYAREGRYPDDLDQLFPRDALSVPKPVILFAQDWCYDAGKTYYRLGYIYREHWSDPHLYGRLYKTAGEVPNLPPLCTAELTALHKRYPSFAAP